MDRNFNIIDVQYSIPGFRASCHKYYFYNWPFAAKNNKLSCSEVVSIANKRGSISINSNIQGYLLDYFEFIKLLIESFCKVSYYDSCNKYYYDSMPFDYVKDVTECIDNYLNINGYNLDLKKYLMDIFSNNSITKAIAVIDDKYYESIVKLYQVEEKELVLEELKD